MYVTIEPTNDSVIVLDSDELEVIRELMRTATFNIDEDDWSPKSRTVIEDLANKLGVL